MNNDGQEIVTGGNCHSDGARLVGGVLTVKMVLMTKPTHITNNKDMALERKEADR